MVYGLVASKLNTSNIFDGCLNVLKKEITDKIPEGKNWMANDGIKALIGTTAVINQHTKPWQYKSPTWYEIYIGKKWIIPSAYSLMGRRCCDNHYLRGWNFSGLNRNDEWVLLHNDTDNSFARYENRTYLLKGNEAYKGFKIEMTQSDSSGEWALCLGQIEVFGNIYRGYFFPKNGVFKCTTMKYFFVSYIISGMHLITLS